MPPVIPRKRRKSDSPAAEPRPKRAARNAPNTGAPRSRESLFDTLDTPPTLSRSLSKTKALLEQEESSSDEESDEDEFEDVVINRGSSSKGNGKQKAEDDESADEEWEDALGRKYTDEPDPVISGDIQVTLSAQPQNAFSRPDGKKGPSKKERRFRSLVHCTHVQFLMYHNLMRNGWIQDKQVQKQLVENLSAGCWRELDRYWKDSGISDGPERVLSGERANTTAEDIENATKWKDTGTKGVKEYSPVKGKAVAKGSSSKTNAETPSKDRTQRDWGASSDRLELNTPNLSAGDPLLRLLKYLTAYWKAKFKIRAPCLRKRGYLSPATLQAETNAWKDDPYDADVFGERIENLEAFRELARKYEGSRDVGQQLFTALLRALGIEARMVASLQPMGFGWSQTEEGKPKNLEKLEERRKIAAKQKDKPISNGKNQPLSPTQTRGRKQASDGTRVSPVHLSDDDSDLSSAISISSDAIQTPRKVLKARKAPPKYGEELPYPTYWTEAISHLTHTPICVSVLPRSLIATSSNPDSLSGFYPRGTAADKAKQVFAYIIAFSSDSTAKDVTTRYLPKHQWPGRTKGFRMPVEKVPIYTKHGKIKSWGEWDWFKSIMRIYARPRDKRQPWDEIEDEGDLVPKQTEKPKGMDEEGGKETLQGYKDSAKYVLERHLHREEAPKPGAKIVRYFTTGKGDKEKKEPVYYRKDIVDCKSVESWHKEGRMIKEGEQPLKFVPMRAVTTARKREIEEREREEGRKAQQGLYSKAQTDWIIPDPIKDGKIPRNAFGNIDVYVKTMVPEGAVHIPLKGTAPLCRKLGIDYAEACTGFEFGNRRAVPVLTGVVVAAENKDLVIDAWKAADAEKKRKERAKKEAVVLGLWRKFMVGMRIVERMKREYGDDAELPSKEVTGTTAAPKKSEWDVFQNHGDGFEGGFLREEPGPSADAAGGFVREDDEENMAGGFLPESPEERTHYNGGLIIDHGEDYGSRTSGTPVEYSRQTPISLVSALRRPVEDVTDEEADENPQPTIPNPQPRPKTTRGKPKARGKQSSSTRRKRPVDDSEIEESSPSDLSPPPTSPESDADEDISSTRKGKRKAATPPPPSTRAVPKRTAARKSDAQLKSHYFAHGSDEETDMSPVKSARGGKGSGRGRGRGRGRGKKDTG